MSVSERKRKTVRVAICAAGALLWIGVVSLIFIRSDFFGAAGQMLRERQGVWVLNVLRALADAIEGRPVGLNVSPDLLDDILDAVIYLLLGLLSVATARRLTAKAAATGILICLDVTALIAETVLAVAQNTFGRGIPLRALGLAAGIGVVYLAAFLWRNIAAAYRDAQAETATDATVAPPRPRAARSSNLEILRIAAILMIMYGHFCTHNAVGTDSSPLGIFNQRAIYLGQIGNCLFLLISGYFLIDSRFCVKKALLLIIQTWFYSFVIMAIFLVWGRYPLSWAQILIMIMPITFQTYWFVTDFVIYYLFTPLLRRLINGRSQKFLAATIGVLFLLCTVTQLCGIPIGYSVLGFFEVALIAAYLRKYPFRRKAPAWALLLAAAAATALLLLFVAAANPGPLALPLLQGKGLWFRSFVSLPMLLIALPLFLLFKNMRPKNITFVNKLAGTTLGVYLLHENYCVRNFAIPELFSLLGVTDQSTGAYAALVLAFTAAAFVVCAAIELLRRRAEKAGLVPLLERWQRGKRLDTFFNALEKKKETA